MILFSNSPHNNPPLSRSERRSSEFGAWLEKVAAIATQGLHYAASEFDKDRYRQLRELVLEAADAGVDGGLTTALERVMVDSVGYWTPKIEVRTGVLSASGRLLLVRERDDGGWSLPGGWLDIGYSPREGAIKEVLEEAGISLERVDLITLADQEALGCSPGLPYHVVKILYRSRVRDHKQSYPQHRHEIIEVDWFAPDQLRQLKLSSKRTSTLMLERVLSVDVKTSLPPSSQLSLF